MSDISRLYDFLAGQPIRSQEVDDELNQLVAKANEAGTAAGLGGGAIMSSLPVSPDDGQEINYLADATNGIVWRLKYRAGSASAYKWEFLGGSPLEDAQSGSQNITSVYPTWVDLTALQVTLPEDGDYIVRVSADLNPTAALNSYLRPENAGSDVYMRSEHTAAGNRVQPEFTAKVLAQAAASVLSAQAAVSGSQISVTRGLMSVLPVRLG